SRPSPCQKVMVCHPKIGGIRTFHRLLTMKPKTTAPMMTKAAIFIPLSTGCCPMFNSLSLSKTFVDRLQTLSQMQHRIVFSREQRVHAETGFGGDVLEAPAH